MIDLIRIINKWVVTSQWFVSFKTVEKNIFKSKGQKLWHSDIFFFNSASAAAKSWHKSSITKSNKTRRDEKGEKTLVPVCWMVMENRTKNGIFSVIYDDDFWWFHCGFYHNFFGHCTTKEKICGIFHPDVSSVNNFSKLISSFFTCFCIEWHWITSLPFHTFYREKTRWHDIVKSREKKRQITTFMWLLNCNKISAFLSWLNSSLFVEHTYKNPMSSWTPLFCFPTSFSWVYIQ